MSFVFMYPKKKRRKPEGNQKDKRNTRGTITQVIVVFRKGGGLARNDLATRGGYLIKIVSNTSAVCSRSILGAILIFARCVRPKPRCGRGNLFLGPFLHWLEVPVNPSRATVVAPPNFSFKKWPVLKPTPPGRIS